MRLWGPNFGGWGCPDPPIGIVRNVGAAISGIGVWAPYSHTGVVQQQFRDLEFKV